MPAPRKLRLALIDNYDSYTHNLAHLLPSPTVIASDAYPSLRALHDAHAPFDGYVLSPGPGTPTKSADFPLLEQEILRSGKPVLAVCLGHQALCFSYGGVVAPNPAGPAHGSVSTVTTAQTCPLFRGVPDRFDVVRYHSLCATCPPDLIPTSYTVDTDNTGTAHTLLMSVRHRGLPLFGLQFHPESVGTPSGPRMVQNFVRLVGGFITQNRIYAPLPTPVPRYRTCIRRRNSALSTPDIFRALFRQSEHAFWLDSSSADQPVSRCSSPGGEPPRMPAARFSILGGDPREFITYSVGGCVSVVTEGGTRKFRETIFEYLRRMSRERFAENHPELPLQMNGGYVGYLGYECKADVVGVRRNRHKSNMPDAWFVFAERFLIVDHVHEELYLVALAEGDNYEPCERWFHEIETILDQPGVESDAPMKVAKGPVLTFTPERSRSLYLEDIRECLEQISRGESYEICLTNRLRTKLPKSIDPFELYCALRVLNPAPYSAYLRFGDVTVCCSSPERFLRISSVGRVESKPIKGTVPRGRSLAEDDHLRRELETSEKDRRENLMIVDLVRNDLSRSCIVGSVQVPRLMHVESYATVHQLVSTVVGWLERPRDVISCVQAAYPMGSMTGAPKVRTMEIIDRLERSARGIYSGSIGYVSLSGAADMNVVIRTAVLKDDHVEIGVGGAIVSLSNPEDEYDEVILKGRAIMSALALKVSGRPEYVVMHENDSGYRDKRDIT